MTRPCPMCLSTADLETNFSSGNVTCKTCAIIVESGILVTEVGFAEGSGGRVHVQGSFVAAGATGVAGLHQRHGGRDSQSVRDEGMKKIHKLGKEMRLSDTHRNAAVRTFALAVDKSFNKGRKSDHVLAACLYLSARELKVPVMLIDFSERLRVNVYELAGTYMKLRNLIFNTAVTGRVLSEQDPAIYMLHFANRLQLYSDAPEVARDASKIAKRFKVDWLTQGRRPAGVCGACLIIAARQHNYLRTPEEVGLIVSCSPTTIRRRLKEFAMTNASRKTGKEWRAMNEDEEAFLQPDATQEPPIVRYNRLKAEQKAHAERVALERAEMDAEGSQSGSEQGDAARLEKSPKGKGKSKRSGSGGAIKGSGLGGGGPSKLSPEEAFAAWQRDTGARMVTDDGEAADDDLQDGDEDDEDLKSIDGGDLALDLDEAGDNPEQARAERLRERKAFKRLNNVSSVDEAGGGSADVGDGGEMAIEDFDIGHGVGLFADDPEEQYGGEDEEYPDGEEEDAEDVQEEDEDEMQPDGTFIKRERATQLKSVSQVGKRKRGPPKLDYILDFDDWGNDQALLDHFASVYFSENPKARAHANFDGDLVNLQKEHVEARIAKWLGIVSEDNVVAAAMTGDGRVAPTSGRVRPRRDPMLVARECVAVDKARARAEYERRTTYVKDIGLTEEEEESIRAYYEVEDEEKSKRARMWNSSNKDWIKKQAEKEEERARYVALHGDEAPQRKRPRKQRNAAARGPQRFATPAEARDAVFDQVVLNRASTKVNQQGLQNLRMWLDGGAGGGGGDGGSDEEGNAGGSRAGRRGLQRMPEEKISDKYSHDYDDDEDLGTLARRYG